MAAAFWANPKRTRVQPTKGHPNETDLKLTTEEKGILLNLAREVIKAKSHGEELPKPELSSPALNEPRGAFVTLHKQGKLRGCIGHIRAKQPLAKTVVDMAVAAAFEDPRFPPVDEKELKSLDLEISVLTPLRRISNVKEIEVGVHGIYMIQGSCSGLLLPQVATEWGWDRTAFLEHTCIKAGLPENAWKEKDTEIYVFSADVFSAENL
ncbi:MAG: AmmeMemoRadiSam system protein A [Deltaproteobacteria bacterium]|nr:MAG: AmmeMemoRadiSam system protein A [Deltaproteobacteria bacterium]